MNVLRCVQVVRFALLSLLFHLLPLLLPAAVLAISVAPLGDFGNVTVMEVAGDFSALNAAGQVNATPRQAVAREFYRSHGDDYDFLVLFTDFDYVMPPGSKAFYLPVRNDVEGIGLEAFDKSQLYASDGSFLERLDGIIEMGPAANHELEPASPGFEKTLLTLTHEMMHRWGAYVRFMDDGHPSDALLGLADAHWSFLLDANGSSLYGNRWRDNQDGTYTSIPPEQAQVGAFLGRIFSPLELYLMGLADRDEVPPLRLVDSPGIDRNRLPEVGVTIPGIVREISIDRIVAAEGERFPAAVNAAREFRMAFVYAVASGTWNQEDPVMQRRLVEIQALQQEWETRFAILTGGIAQMKTQFVPRYTVAANPGLEVNTVNPAIAPSVLRGVDWLVARRGANGSWQDQSGTAVRDTAAAVRALKPFPSGVATTLAGEAWLSGATPENHDYFARTLLAIAADDPTSLMALQNVDGGWGAGPGYRSNPVDTALALRALTGQGSNSPAVINAAINFLHNKQNPDGGWNIGHGASMIQPTAYALLALNDYRDKPGYTLEPTIADGMEWLNAKRNPDGGFGNSPSTVYDTAAALSALKVAGASQASIDSAINYLLDSQADSGSWHGSVFQTAMAVEALYAGQVAPDLTLSSSDIVFTPASVAVVPADVTVTVTVRNLGSTVAESVDVMLYAGDPALGNLVGQQTVGVPGGGSADAVFTTTVADFGLHPFHAVIDAADQLAESNERNNSAAKTFAANVPPPTVGFVQTASAGPEAQTSVALAVSLSYPWFEPITVNYSVNAAGTALPGGDYNLAAGVLTFAPDETVKNVPLTIVNDALAEIDKTVIVDLLDPSPGTLGIAQHVYTIRDDEPPVVTISSPPAGVTGTATPQLLYSTTGSEVVVRVDGAVVSKVSGENLDPLAEGNHFVEVAATNGLGLTGIARVEFNLDISLPLIVINSPAGTVSDNTPGLDFSATHATAVEVKIDGVVVDKVSGDSLDQLSEGAHVLTVRAWNSTGALSTATAVFTVDTIPPSLEIISPQNAYLRDTSPVLLYSTQGPGQQPVAWLDGQVIQAENGRRLEPLTAGLHHLRLEIADEAGNIGFDEVSFVISISNEDPFVTAPGWPKLDDASYGGVDVDAEGNVYIATKKIDGEYSLVKYNSRGEKLWKDTNPSFYNPADMDPADVAVDSSGNIYVVGYGWYNTCYFGFLAKFNKDGDHVQSLIYRTDYLYASATPSSVHVDKSDNVYIAGNSAYGLFDGNRSTQTTYFIAKYDNDLNLISGRGYGYPHGEEQFYVSSGSLHVDQGGNVYLTGVNGSSQMVMLKLNQDLTLSGIKTTGFASTYGTDVDVDSSGNIYVSGSASSGGYLWKFDSAGNLASSMAVSPLDALSSVVANDDGTVYVLDANGTLIKLDADLSALWTTDNGADCNAKLVTDDNGNLIVGGSNSGRTCLSKLADPRIPDFSFDKSVFYTSGAQATISGHIEPGYVVKLEGFQYNQVSFASDAASGEWQMELDGFAEGDNRFAVAVVDDVGLKKVYAAAVVVDAESPVVQITTPQNGVSYSARPVLEYSASDGEVKVYLNGVAVTKQSGFTLDSLRQGQNNIRVQSTDLAGNVGFDEVTLYANGLAAGEYPLDITAFARIGASGEETVADTAHDGAGNIYVLGDTSNGFPGYPAHGRDVFVAKFDQGGLLVNLWQFGSNLHDYAQGIAVAANGAFYVTYMNEGNVVVAKYEANGTLAWSDTLDSGALDQSTDIELDAFGNVYVSGVTEGRLNNKKHGGAWDYFVVKYNGQGRVGWTLLSNKPTYDKINDMTIDSDGSIYATGRANDYGSMSLIKISPSGVVLWEKEYKYANHYMSGSKLRLGPDNHLYTLVESNYSNDYFIAKHDRNGNLVWDAHHFNPAGSIYALDMDVDVNSGIYLTGYLANHYIHSTQRLSFDGNESFGGQDVFLAKHAAADGRKVWSRQFGDEDFQRGGAVIYNGYNSKVYLAGVTEGAFGGVAYGNQDVFLAVMAPLSEPDGPELTIYEYTSPTNSLSQQISGTSTLGAGIAVTVDSPPGSPATVSTVNHLQNGSWSFTVDNLAGNADNVLTIHATNAFGTTSQQIVIAVDTLPPTLTVNPVASPTGLSSQVISGSIDNGANLTVEVNPPSQLETVPVSSGSWSYELRSLGSGDNIVTFTASDSVGNTTTRAVTITYEPPPPLSLMVSPALIAENEGTEIFLAITNVATAGGTVTVEQVLDLNQNGVTDPGEPLVRRFLVTDGVAPDNPNLAADSDGLADGAITTRLNAWFINDRYHATGQYVFTARTATDGDDESFSVVEAVQPQSLSGMVQDAQGGAVAGALVELRDAWGRSFGFAMSDATGRYRFNLAWPGEYVPVPMMEGFAFDRAFVQTVVVPAGQAVVRDLPLADGAYQVTGRVLDGTTQAGLSGVLVYAEGSQYLAVALTAADGSYSLNLPGGDYGLRVEARSGDGLASHGYLASTSAQRAIQVNGDLADQDLLAISGDSLVCGIVRNAIGTAVGGVPVQAYDTQSNAFSETISAGQGEFCTVLAASGTWQVALNDGLAHGTRLIGTLAASASPSLTAYAIDSWVSGIVSDENAQPLNGVLVAASHASGLGAAVQTTTDGRYLLGLSSESAGEWSLTVHGDALGYEPSAPVQVAPVIGQTLLRDFVLVKTTEPANSIVIITAAYHAKKKTLTVHATSDYGADAALVLDGAGPMSWNSRQARWERVVTGVAVKPGTVTVLGPEGSTTTPVN